jgi:hypothetical protein
MNTLFSGEAGREEVNSPAKGLRVMLANPIHDPGHVLFDAPGRKGQIPTTQEAQANVEYINRLIEIDEGVRCRGCGRSQDPASPCQCWNDE